MKFGNYYLNQNFHEVENELEDISEQMFSLGFMKKAFNDERIFKGKQVTFLDHSWDTVVGVTNDKVYKIALQYQSVKVEAEGVFASVFKYLEGRFGNYSERKTNGNSLFNIWDTEWGNIILEQKDEGGEELINIFLTSNAPIKNLSFSSKARISSKSIGQRLNLFGKKIGVIWNPSEHSDDENLRWCWLRAIEWGDWPLFISQPIIPILFLFFPWWQIVIAIVILTWLWAFIRYKYINITLADLGPLFVLLKWPISVGVGIYFLIKHNYFLAVISTFWPLITLLISHFFSPHIQIGKLQKIFMDRLGYTRRAE